MNKVDKKIRAITAIIGRLKNNKQVRPEELSKVLTKKDLADIEEHLRYQQAISQLGRPSPISRYAEKVRIACLYYAKMEKYHLPPVNSTLSKKFANKAESAFEAALEYIREMIQIDAELQIWLDRDVEDVKSYCPVGIPRVIGSESAECRNKNKVPYPMLSKRQIIIEQLEDVLDGLQDHTLEQFMVDPPERSYSTKIRNLDITGFKF